MVLDFRQVDVFGEGPLLGNPVAVVHDADALSTRQMSTFARWTNLSETTFLLEPTSPGADYRLRIFTPERELPFAGHPTLGSAHAWLEAGGVAQAGDRVVQQCAAGLVVLRRGSGRLAFEAPPLVRSGPVEADVLARALRVLGVGSCVEAAWIDNGPGWLGVWLQDAAAVLALRPSAAEIEGLDLGVAGPHPAGSPEAVEVRAFFAGGGGVVEDPVTGSLNAAIGQWQAGGRLPAAYVASQGTLLQRRGRIHVERREEQVLVGGATRTVVSGSVDLAGT